MREGWYRGYVTVIQHIYDTFSNNNLKYSEYKKDPNPFKRINQVISKISKID